MSTALSTLLPLIHIPRCPDSLQLQALRNACRQFCRDTEWWREEVTDDQTNPLNNGYADTQIIRTQWVKVDDNLKHEAHWTVSNAGILTFDPALSATADVIKAKVVLMPTITATSADDFLVSRFGQAIAAGAKFNLKSDKGSERDPTPWYDPSGAALAREEYRDGVELAKMEVYSEMQSGNKQIDLDSRGW
jgi:hypothetical protein